MTYCCLTFGHLAGILWCAKALPKRNSRIPDGSHRERGSLGRGMWGNGEALLEQSRRANPLRFQLRHT